ncbi:hypothetical protein ACVR0T_11275, partial [Streptococcus chenjunshii]
SDLDGLSQAVNQGLSEVQGDLKGFSGTFPDVSTRSMPWLQTIQTAIAQQESNGSHPYQAYLSKVQEQDFDKEVQKIAQESGLTVEEVMDYILMAKAPVGWSKKAQKVLATYVKYRDGKAFLNGQAITVDTMGRIKWGKRFLYNKTTGNVYNAGKELQASSGIDIAKTSYARTAAGTLDWKEAGRVGKVAFKEAINPLTDFKGWKGATKLTKTGKFLGILSTGLTIGSNINENFIKSDNGVNDGKNWANFAVDTSIDLGSAAGATAAGAAIGSFFVPPLGTVIGAGVGMFANVVLNYDFEFFGKQSITGWFKESIKGVYGGND